MMRHNSKVIIAGTDLQVTKLGLGTAPLGGLFTSVLDSDSDELINAAFENGLNFLIQRLNMDMALQRFVWAESLRLKESHLYSKQRLGGFSTQLIARTRLGLPMLILTLNRFLILQLMALNVQSKRVCNV
jgi:hypothetical protein